MGFAAVLQPNEAKAVYVKDTTNPIHLQLAADLYLKGAAWVQYTRPDGSVAYASAAQINEHTFVLAAHELIRTDGSRNTLNFIGNSLNFNLPGAVATPAEIHIKDEALFQANPVNWTNISDLAVVFTAQDLPWAYPGQTLPFQALAVDDVATMVGVGYFGDPVVGNLGQTGDTHGGKARITSDSLFGYSLSLYFEGRMPSSTNIDGIAYAAPGDSGGGWFFEIPNAAPGTPEYSLCGIASYASVFASPRISGVTGANRVDGENGDFINTAIANYQPTPEPGVFALLAPAAIGLLGFRRTRHSPRSSAPA